MRKHGVSSRGENRDSGQHKILAKVHWGFRWWCSFLKLLTTETQRHSADKGKNKTINDFLRVSVPVW
jgi:hypothetical protein